jgi:hypothetical protein
MSKGIFQFFFTGANPFKIVFDQDGCNAVFNCPDQVFTLLFYCGQFFAKSFMRNILLCMQRIKMPRVFLAKYLCLDMVAQRNLPRRGRAARNGRYSWPGQHPFQLRQELS